MREISTIVGLEVVGVADGKVVGRVSQVVYDLSTGKMEGLITGTGAGERGVPAENILTIGADAVMVPNAEAAVRLSDLPALMGKRKDPEAQPLRAVTDDGQKLGQVSRVWIDPVARVVTRFEVSAGLLRDLAEGPLMLPIVPGSTHGEDTLVVPALALMEMSGGHQGGLRAQMQHLSEKVKEQSAAARHQAEESAKAAREKIEKAVETARKQTSEVAQKAREQTADLAEKASKQTAEVAQKASKGATDLAHKAQEGATAVATMAKEQAHRGQKAEEPVPVPHRGEDEGEELEACSSACNTETGDLPAEGAAYKEGTPVPHREEDEGEELEACSSACNTETGDLPAEGAAYHEAKLIPHRGEDDIEEPEGGTVNWDEPTPPPVEGAPIEDEPEHKRKKKPKE